MNISKLNDIFIIVKDKKEALEEHSSDFKIISYKEFNELIK